jgi:hypothetical protein
MAASPVPIMEAMRRQCLTQEGSTTDTAVDRVFILMRREAFVRKHSRHMVSRMGEEHLLMTPEHTDDLPLLDEMEDLEWLGR